MLDAPGLGAQWQAEPDLLFAGDHRHVNPKIGIPLYGPRSLDTPRHKHEVHVGFIGPAQAVRNARDYLAECAKGLDGPGYHYPFPGCSPELGYRFDLRFSDTLIEKITETEKNHLLEKGIRQKERFERALELLLAKLDLLCGKDDPLDYIVVVLTQELYSRLRVAEFTENGQRVHRDFRRAFKARAMKWKKPTQILLESTTGKVKTSRSLDKDSTRAWNLFTGMYFKTGGLPWAPADLRPASCYVGVSFYHPLGESKTMRASVARAFDENGEGLVLRGQKFEWNEDENGKSPHLPREHAASLMRDVLELYQRERHQQPTRVIVHKTSRFEPDEKKGFQEGLTGVSEHDLVAVYPTSDVRLLRTGKYPPLRGTRLTIENEEYLYTTGYMPAISAFPHGHVPSPLRIVDHVDDTPTEDILREILILTKMNWNSANMDGLFPITLTFSRLVGDILREVPEDAEPEPKYSYYM